MSTSETQSMVLLQAMASGLPVIAADTRALPEFVSPANGMLVDPHDPVRLARGAGGGTGLAGTAAGDGFGGQTVRENYGIETVTDAWETLYRSVRQGSSVE